MRPGLRSGKFSKSTAVEIFGSTYASANWGSQLCLTGCSCIQSMVHLPQFLVQHNTMRCFDQP